MIGAPLLSSFTTLDLMWMDPPYSTKDLRLSKAHMDSGGTVHVRRTVGKAIMTATVTGQGNASPPRTSETGLLLQVDLMPSTTLNEMERIISMFRQVYISRTEEDHLAVPKIHQYSMDTKTLSQASPDAQTARNAGLATRSLQGIYPGLISDTETTSYFLIQGNIARSMWIYPALQAPLIFAIIAMVMTYYNLSTSGVVVWIF